MNSSTLIFMELQIKEYRQCLEKEAQEISMVTLSCQSQRKIRCRWMINFANFLISLGEKLKENTDGRVEA